AVVEEAAPEGVEAAALLGGRLARAHERDLALGGEVGEGVNEVGDFGQAREVGLAYGVVARLLGEGLASRRGPRSHPQAVYAGVERRQVHLDGDGGADLAERAGRDLDGVG